MNKLKLTPEIAKEILSIKPKTRGIDVRSMADYVRKKGGEKKLKEVENLLKKVGYPMPYDSLQKIRPYTLGERLIYLSAIKEVLGWGDDQLEQMGYYVGKNLILIKFFSHLFKVNKKFVFTVIPKIGSRYMEGLKIVPVKADIKKRIVTFKIEGLKIKQMGSLKEVERIGLAYFGGFFAGWAQMVLGKESVKCNAESKKGEYYFTIRW